LNVHGRENFKRLCKDLSTVEKNAIIFLCETWTVQTKSLPLFPSKDHFVVHADKHTKGRPFGGLEIYVSRHLQAQERSKSPHHIVVDVGSTSVIGVYYRPNLDLDEIITDLALATSSCGHQDEIVLCGDFNLHHGTREFEELEEFLDSCGISLRSDPNVSTFFHHAGRSTPDHLFASRTIEMPSCRVGNLHASDHEPITAVFKVARKMESFAFTKTTLGRIDIAQLESRLDQISANISPSAWISQCSAAVQNSRKIVRPRKDKKKPWYDEFFADCAFVFPRMFGLRTTNASRGYVPAEPNSII